MILIRPILPEEVPACVLIEVGPQVIHCGQLAHRLAYPCYHKMSQDTIGYPVEADAVIDRVEDQLGAFMNAESILVKARSVSSNSRSRVGQWPKSISCCPS